MLLVGSSVDCSDAQVIAQVRSGHLAIFAILYERHHKAALNHASRLTAGSRVDADDCVADAFELVFKMLKRGEGPDRFFRAYLLTVMRNLIMTKKAEASNSFTVENFEVLEAAAFTRLHVENPIPDPVVERFETEVIIQAFRQMPERWQAVLWYIDVEGLTPTQVGIILELSPKATSMLRLRARDGLRSAYRQQHDQ